MKKLNIGCGKDIRKGWTNLDSHNTYGAEVVFDLNKISKGEKLPFKNKQFDYIYCSHVIEDFIEPMDLINEMIRICKIGGEIEIKTPFETNNNLTNIHHKSSFTLCKFNSITQSWGEENYVHKYKLKIKELHYYADNGKYRIVQIMKKIITGFYNLLPYKLIERTFIKYLFCILNCRVVYERIE